MADDLDRSRTGGRIRLGSIFVRAAHLLAASVVAGACILRVDGSGTRAWWITVAASGVLLLVTEFVMHRELHRELAGWSTALKLCFIGLIPVVPAAAPWLMSAAFVVAVLGAHAPRRWRHRRLF